MNKYINADRTVIVTGAAGDLGAAIALRFAEEGYKVSITGRASRQPELERLAEAITKLGAKCFIVTGDVAEEADVQHIVSETVKNLGPLDVMVANAGKYAGSPITEMTTQLWDEILHVNLRSVMLCYKTAANQMLKQRKEDPNRKAHYRLIGGCSIAGISGLLHSGAYSASKFAIRGLTQVTARELGEFGITVNNYAPGFVGGTKMVDVFVDSATDIEQVSDNTWYGKTVAATSTKALGAPRNVAAIVSYIASPDADWTTGQTIVVDGGMYMP